MVAVIIAWIAYCFLFVQFLFNGFRIGDFITTVLIVAVLFILLVLWTIHKLTEPAKRRIRAAAPAPAPAPEAVQPVHSQRSFYVLRERQAPFGESQSDETSYLQRMTNGLWVHRRRTANRQANCHVLSVTHRLLCLHTPSEARR